MGTVYEITDNKYFARYFIEKHHDQHPTGYPTTIREWKPKKGNGYIFYIRCFNYALHTFNYCEAQLIDLDGKTYKIHFMIYGCGKNDTFTNIQMNNCPYSFEEVINMVFTE